MVALIILHRPYRIPLKGTSNGLLNSSSYLLNVHVMQLGDESFESFEAGKEKIHSSFWKIHSSFWKRDRVCKHFTFIRVDLHPRDKGRAPSERASRREHGGHALLLPAAPPAVAGDQGRHFLRAPPADPSSPAPGSTRSVFDNSWSPVN
jgi:hypothetical protein